MPEPLRLAILLVPAGACVGLIGSLVGIGGGFFIVPFLLMAPVVRGVAFLPNEATAVSLAVILMSAASATSANARRRRIDFRTGLVLGAGTVPGAWIGRDLVGRLDAPVFCACFAALLVLVAAYVAFVRLKERRGMVRGAPREVVDSEGQTYRYEANAVLGFAVSLGVGVIASLFGVAGGLLLVPFMVLVYGMPVLVATATSQFTFLFTTSAGLLESVRRGHLPGTALPVILFMGLGVMAGAQLGVAAAKKVRPGLVQLVLSAVLAVTAMLMVLNAFSGAGPR